MKFMHGCLVAIGVLLALSGVASAQSNDAIMRRLEALESSNTKLAQENVALRDRVRRIESKEQPAARTATNGSDSRAIYNSASRAAVYKAAPPVPAQQSPWNGFYIGAHGGYASATANGPSQSFDQTGGFGGVQMGANYQFWGNWLIGLESDVSVGDIKGSIQPFNEVGAQTLKFDYFGTIRARLGVIWGPALLYGTGGVAWSHVKVDSMTNMPHLPADRIMTGLAGGGGAEWAATPDLTLKIEYLYLDFPAKNFQVNSPAAGGCCAVDTFAHTVKFGANWLFH